MQRPFVLKIVGFSSEFNEKFIALISTTMLWIGVKSKRKEAAKMESHLAKTGQSLLEYALIIILVAIVVLIILYLFGPALGNMYSNIIQNI
jgi:pilus assembly protein Flp/PilA